MGLSRRFQNLMLDSPVSGSKWLRSIDLTRQLFDNTGTPPTTTGEGSESAVKDKKQLGLAALKLERIQLSRPIFRFHATAHPKCRTIDCFPLSDGKMVIADQTGGTFLFDVDTRHVVSMPNLQKKKSRSISLFVPCAEAEYHPSNIGTLYVMESIPSPEKGDNAQPSDQFEAFVSSKPTGTSEGLWHSQLLPPPPFVRDPAYWFTYPLIRSYALVGSNICVSMVCNATEHIATYCLDTVSNTWEVGTRELPFFGNVEYVPELKLWFGLSSATGPLAAADLSAMDSQPQLVGDWEEFYPPEGFSGWIHSCKSQLVNLGSGRFCIIRFFKPLSLDDEDGIVRIVIFTGVEVTPVVHDGSGNRKVKLCMKKHKSRYHMSKGNTNTIQVF